VGANCVLLQGFVPSDHLNLEEGAEIADVFFLGQMMKCRVIRPKKNVRGMLLSFNLQPTGTPSVSTLL
jgi:hypothetical protein